MSVNTIREPGSPLSSSRPSLSDPDYAFACEKRRQGASWDAIGRMLRRPADAIRRACDPTYRPLHISARPVAVAKPEDALARRLRADGVPSQTATMIVTLFALGGGPVASQTVLDSGRVLSSLAGAQARRSAAKAFADAAGVAGYPVVITKAGCAFTAAARASLATRINKPVR